MTLDAYRRETLLRTVRARDFRLALHAIAELRADDGPGRRAERLVAARKGIAPERLAARITSHGTGLLDQKILLTALRRLQGLSPE